jgi:hypothetical protein
MRESLALPIILAALTLGVIVTGMITLPDHRTDASASIASCDGYTSHSCSTEWESPQQGLTGAAAVAFVQ